MPEKYFCPIDGFEMKIPNGGKLPEIELYHCYHCGLDIPTTDINNPGMVKTFAEFYIEELRGKIENTKKRLSESNLENTTKEEYDNLDAKNLSKKIEMVADNEIHRRYLLLLVSHRRQVKILENYERAHSEIPK